VLRKCNCHYFRYRVCSSNCQYWVKVIKLLRDVKFLQRYCWWFKSFRILLRVVWK